MDSLVTEFIKKRSISPDMELNEPLYNAIYYLEKANEFVEKSCEEHIDRLSEIVPWRSMHDMYQRSYEYCCGVLGCFLIGQFPSSEALCRTAIEGAINLHYVSLGDSMGKQIAYFKTHIENERKQNTNWKYSVEQSGYLNDTKNHHLECIREKDAALDQYEIMLRESLFLAGVDYDAVDIKWPSIFDRFREVDKEVGYRTVYAALCSQAHNDAEDVLNKILSRVIANVEGLEEAQWVEQYNFSLYLLLTAFDYHILASAMYLGKFGINSNELVTMKNEIMGSIVLVTEHGQKSVKARIRVNENP